MLSQILKSYQTDFNQISYILLTTLLLFSSGCAEKELYPFPTKVTIGKEYLLQTDLEQDTTEKIASHLQNAIDNYKEFIPFPTKRGRRVRILIFKEQINFDAYRDQVSTVKSKTGFYIPDRAELGLVYRGVDNTVRSLYHELFHAYFEDRIIHPPAWLNEGLAEYAEVMPFGLLDKLTLRGSGDQWISTLNKINRHDAFPSLRDVVERDWPNRHQLSQEQYAISWSLAYFFNKTKNDQIRESFQHYLNLLYKKKEPKKAFYEAFPDVEAVDEEWKKFTKTLLLKKKLFL